MKIPSTFGWVLISLLMFVGIQWFSVGVHMYQVKDLYYPYGPLGQVQGKTQDSFGPRNKGCNLYQRLSAGKYLQNVSLRDRILNMVDATLMVFVFIAVVTLLITFLVPKVNEYVFKTRVTKISLFYLPLALASFGCVNMLYSSLTQIFFADSSAGSQYKAIAHDFLGSYAQYTTLNNNELSAKILWYVQVTLNLIASCAALCLILVLFDNNISSSDVWLQDSANLSKVDLSLRYLVGFGGLTTWLIGTVFAFTNPNTKIAPYFHACAK